MSFLARCCCCCCFGPSQPSKREPLSDRDIEKLTQEHIAERSSSATRPPSYASRTRSQISSHATITPQNHRISSLITVTPHTTGTTLCSNVVSTNYTGRNSTRSHEERDNLTHELANAQEWDAKPRPRSMNREEVRGEVAEDKEAEAELEGRGRERERTEGERLGRRSARETVVWDDLEVPPPAYTPNERGQ